MQIYNYSLALINGEHSSSAKWNFFFKSIPDSKKQLHVLLIILQCYLETLELATGMLLLGLGESAIMPSHIASVLKAQELRVKGQGKDLLSLLLGAMALIIQHLDKSSHDMRLDHTVEFSAKATNCVNLPLFSMVLAIAAGFF